MIATGQDFRAAVQVKHQERARIIKPIGDGPGTELFLIAKDAGWEFTENCQCPEHARQMNAWGPGCREHKNEIVGWLIDTVKPEPEWAEDVATFLGNIIDEAIRRAEAKEAVKKKYSGGVRVLRQLKFDETNLFPNLAGKRFNSSIIEYGDGYAMAFRDGWQGSRIHVAIFSIDFAPLHCHTLDLHHQFANVGCEDPRLFRSGADGIGDAAIWCAFIGVARNGGKLWTSQMYAQLDDWRTRSIHAPDWSGRNEWEKNWSFFFHGRQLFSIYSHHPMKILAIDGSNARLAHESHWRCPWTEGEIRGGASPMRVGDSYYSFFHARVGSWETAVYRTGCIKFQAAPPFRVTHCTRHPLLVANSETKPRDVKPAVVFTNGAILQDGCWILSSGVHDRWCHIDWLDFEEVESMLEPV